jgi:hypothetical protein
MRTARAPPCGFNEGIGMVWSRKLPKPIYLNDGRTIHTLAAARDLMLSLPQHRQIDAPWQDVAQFLLAAARHGQRQPVRDAGTIVTRVLLAEGLL